MTNRRTGTRTPFEYLQSIFLDPPVTWEDLAFIRNHTPLPVLLKEIVHPDDARTAVEKGVDGIIVSNHGGRQLDGPLGRSGRLRALHQQSTMRYP